MVVNKMDILRELGMWIIRFGEGEAFIKFQNENEMRDYFVKFFPEIDVHFSDSPERI